MDRFIDNAVKVFALIGFCATVFFFQDLWAWVEDNSYEPYVLLGVYLIIQIGTFVLSGWRAALTVFIACAVLALGLLGMASFIEVVS